MTHNQTINKQELLNSIVDLITFHHSDAKELNLRAVLNGVHGNHQSV